MSMAFTPNPGAPSAPPAPGGAPRPGNDIVLNGSTATFVEDVIEASMTQPVVVDFWAPWCGPCKTLGPIIEKVVRDTKGAVKLVKIDIDRNPELASQLRIQSIPAVYAFAGGRPVDGFVGALPESQVKAFVQKLMANLGPEAGIEEALGEAKALLDGGDAASALEVYQSIAAEDQANPVAAAGVLKALIALKRADEAKKLLDQIPAEMAKHADIVAVRATLELAEQAGKAGSTAALEAKLAVDPKDHQARFDLAAAQFAAGQKEEAIENLLELFRRDRKWNEEAARKQLVKLFEAMGPTDPLTVGGRKRLSSLLFA
jgi:putative thioredoxin